MSVFCKSDLFTYLKMKFKACHTKDSVDTIFVTCYTYDIVQGYSSLHVHVFANYVTTDGWI